MGVTENGQLWDELAAWLGERSTEICKENGCDQGEHYCESYAYIAEDGVCLDVCVSDYWRGWGSDDEKRHGKLAVIALPFHGNGSELRDAVEENAD